LDLDFQTSAKPLTDLYYFSNLIRSLIRDSIECAVTTLDDYACDEAPGAPPAVPYTKEIPIKVSERSTQEHDKTFSKHTQEDQAKEHQQKQHPTVFNIQTKTLFWGTNSKVETIWAEKFNYTTKRK
jgi:hypothetical protein